MLDARLTTYIYIRLPTILAFPHSVLLAFFGRELQRHILLVIENLQLDVVQACLASLQVCLRVVVFLKASSKGGL